MINAVSRLRADTSIPRFRSLSASSHANSRTGGPQAKADQLMRFVDAALERVTLS